MCRTASSGREGLELIESHQFDVLLLDLKMPDIDGAHLLKILKNHPKAPPVKILFTGYIDLIPSKSEYQCDAIIEKPFRLAVVRDEITRVLGQKSLIPPRNPMEPIRQDSSS